MGKRENCVFSPRFSTQVKAKSMIPDTFNSLPHNPDFKRLKMKHFESIVGNGENAGNPHFLLFPRFLPIPKRIFFFKLNLFCRL